MKQVAGTIKLDLAQYREMEAFSQFSSDLDQVTQRLLARGARLTQLLKQDQYAPMPVEEQVISLYAGVHGFLEDVEVNDVVTFERELLTAFRDKHRNVLDEIRESGALTDDIEAKIRSGIEGFKQSRAA